MPRKAKRDLTIEEQLARGPIDLPFLTLVLLLLVVGVVHTGVAYVLYFGSMDGLKTQTVALFGYIDPVVALVLSAALLGERMSVWGVLGAVLILGSAILCEWRE